MLVHDHVSLSNQLPVKIEVNCCVMFVHSSTGKKTKLQSIMICKWCPDGSLYQITIPTFRKE